MSNFCEYVKDNSLVIDRNKEVVIENYYND